MILVGVLNTAGNVVDELTEKKSSSHKIKGTVVLMKNNVLDLNALHSTAIDTVFEFLGQQVTLQLVSAETADSGQSFSSFVLFNFHHLIACMYRLRIYG